jgi:hypothetical protein
LNNGAEGLKTDVANFKSKHSRSGTAQFAATDIYTVASINAV